MTILAGRLNREAAPDILQVRDRFQVIWVDAGPIAAGVIQFAAVGNLPLMRLIAENVGIHHLAPDVELAITIRENPASPNPATINCLTDVPAEEFFHWRKVIAICHFSRRRS